MKIYVSHSSKGDFKTELYEPLKSGLPNHTLIFPHEESSEPENTWDTIRGVDAVLAEVSTPSTGQGIEIGWADASGIPVVALHKVGTTPSSSLGIVAKKVLTYENVQDIPAVARVLVNTVA